MYLCTPNLRRGIEQLVARRAHNPEVAGSSPAPATTFIKRKSLIIRDFLCFRPAPFRFSSCTGKLPKIRVVLMWNGFSRMQDHHTRHCRDFSAPEYPQKAVSPEKPKPAVLEPGPEIRHSTPAPHARVWFSHQHIRVRHGCGLFDCRIKFKIRGI